MAVLTNKPVRFSSEILSGLGVREYFFRVYGGNSFEKKKPDPVGVAKLLEESGVARERALEVVGFYHSHPRGSAEPSPVDRETAWPWYVYLIVDPVAGVARAWRLADDRSTFAPVAVEEAW